MINLSKTGSYALKAVIYLANNNDKFFTIKEISTNLYISEALLRRIIANLEGANIIKSVKGRNGGVKLAKETSQINIYDILKASGENMNISDCTGGIKCSNIDSCSTTQVLNNIQKGFNILLKMQTLDKIIK